jgi:hypothetical protein
VSPLAGATGIAALADVTAPSTKAATAGILTLDTFMAFSSQRIKRDVTSMEERLASAWARSIGDPRSAPHVQ